MFKFIFRSERKSTTKATYSFPLGVDAMPTISLGMNDEFFYKDFLPARLRENRPNYRLLKKRRDSRHTLS
jgi:hypothetical protein